MMDAPNKGPRSFVAWGVVFILLVVGIVLLVYRNTPGLATFLGARSELPNIQAVFTCDEGKTIAASFYTGTHSRVSLVLSDGRTLVLPQAISASGARYADDSVVFWNKGNTAFIEEGADSHQTYVGCITANEAPQQGWETYASSTLGVSVNYPRAYGVAPYAYTVGQNNIYGVKFSVPEAQADDTNLAADTGVSIETLPVRSCNAAAFLPKMLNRKELLITDEGVEYIIATSSDAAAGNRYEEFVYARKGSSPCVAVRYFIHFGAIENYDQGQVKEFDRQQLLQDFDRIRHSLTLK